MLELIRPLGSNSMLSGLELEMTVHTFSMAQVAEKSVSEPLRSQMHQQGALGVRQACHEIEWRRVLGGSIRLLSTK